MKDKWYILFLSILGLLFYTLTLRGVYGSPDSNAIKKGLDHVTSPFESSHERGPYVLMLSLIQHHSFGFDQNSANVAYPDVGYYNGKYFIFFPPGISLLIIPLFLLGQHLNLGQVGAYFTISLFATAILVFLFKIGKDMFKFPSWIALTVALIFGFATTAWSYASTIYQHQVTVFFIVASFYAVWKFKQQGKNSWVWAIFVWFNYGFAILVDYPDALLMLPIIVYFFLVSFKFLRKRNIASLSFRLSFLLTALVFIIITGLHGYYNYKNFGGWTKLSGGLVGYKEIKQEQKLTPAQRKAVFAAVQQKKQPVKFFREDNIINGLYELLVSIDRGIFLYSPIFILAVLGIFITLPYLTMESSVLLGIIVADVFLYASFGDPYGGWSYGPRYMIPAMSALSLFIGMWLTKVNHYLWARIVTFFLFALSSAIALLGALTTNLVPPKVEAVPLHIRYDFLANLTYITKGTTGDFIYNQFLNHTITLTAYYFLLYEVLLIFVYCVLFILPKYTKK